MKNYDSLVFILIPSLLLFLSSAAIGQQTSQTTDAQSTGSITGKVVNEAGQPLAGANVFIRQVGSTTQGRATITNLEGSFQLDGLDPALYVVSSSSPAYVSAPSEPDTPPATYRLGDSIRLELMKGGVITGTVTNASGEPLVGVPVRASRVRDMNGKPMKVPVIPDGETTDDRGIYRIYGLLPGTYLVLAGGSGSPGSVNAFNQDAPTFSPASTRDTAAELTVRGGEEVTADIRYRGDQGHSISGTVRVSGTGSATVTITPVGERPFFSGFAFQPAGSRGFMVGGLPDGYYDLTGQEAIPTGTAYPNVAYSEPLRVRIKGSDVTGIELIPKPLGSISGKVSLVSSTIAECQNKRRPLFSEMMISTITNTKKDEQSAQQRMFAISGPPDKEGNFSLRNLRAGQYVFATRFYARYWYLQSITLASSASASGNKVGPGSKTDLGRNWTSLKSGERVTGLVVNLALGAATVRGKVTTTEGITVPADLRVYFVPAEREEVDDAFRYFATAVSSDGTFSVGNLAPGKYWVVARNAAQPELSSLEKLRLPNAIEARSKLLRDAEGSKIAIDLKPCQNISNYELPLKQM